MGGNRQPPVCVSFMIVATDRIMVRDIDILL